MKFKTYSPGELQICASQFTRSIKKLDPKLNPKTPAWTELILDYFAATAQKKIVVDGRRSRRNDPGRGAPIVTLPPEFEALVPMPRRTAGEFLFDMCHSTYPPYNGKWRYGEKKYWEEALTYSPELLLVLESEWGRGNARTVTLGMILEDASKLLHVSARAKVVIFGSSSEASHTDVLELAEQMAKADRTLTIKGERPCWLWIDIPWNAEGASFRLFLGGEQ